MKPNLSYEMGVSACNLVSLNLEGKLHPSFDLEGHTEAIVVALNASKADFLTSSNAELCKFIEGFISEADNLNIHGLTLLEVFKALAYEDYEAITQRVVLTERIGVKKSIADKIQEILDIEEGAAEDYGRNEIIHVEVFEFEDKYKILTDGNGWFIDVKVCNGDTPYVDPVLFLNENGAGSEIQTNEVEDTFLGEYEFEEEGFLYGVPVTVVLSGTIFVE